MTRTLEFAQTWLFVPGDRLDRLPKALGSGAHEIIVDLEDGVDPSRKDDARAAVVEALSAGQQFVIRVSAAGTDDFGRDLEAVTSAAGRPRAIMVAKAENAHELADIAQRTGVPLVPLIESAAGLLAAYELARAESVVRLAFGAIDYMLDIGATDADALTYARSHLVATSRAAGRAAPIDTPSVEFGDLVTVREEARRAARLGFGGKLCIHPAQVPEVAAAFIPSPEQLDEARRVLAAANGEGAASVDGKMIDRPVVERARRALVAAGVEQ